MLLDPFDVIWAGRGILKGCFNIIPLKREIPVFECLDNLLLLKFCAFHRLLTIWMLLAGIGTSMTDARIPVGCQLAVQLVCRYTYKKKKLEDIKNDVFLKS